MSPRSQDDIDAEIRALEERARELAARKQALAAERADVEKYRTKVEIPIPAIREQLMSYAVFLRTKAMGDHVGVLEAAYLPTTIAEVKDEVERRGATTSNHLRPLVEWLELLESDRFMGSGPHVDTSYKLTKDAIALAEGALRVANGGDVGNTVRQAIDEAYDQIANKANSGKGPYDNSKGYDFVPKDAADFKAKLEACKAFVAKTDKDLAALQQEACDRILADNPRKVPNVGWDGKTGKEGAEPKTPEQILEGLKAAVVQSEALFDYAKGMSARKGTWRTTGKETYTVAEALDAIASVAGSSIDMKEVEMMITRLARSNDPMKAVSDTPMGQRAWSDRAEASGHGAGSGTAVALVDRGGTGIAKT